MKGKPGHVRPFLALVFNNNPRYKNTTVKSTIKGFHRAQSSVEPTQPTDTPLLGDDPSVKPEEDSIKGEDKGRATENAEAGPAPPEEETADSFIRNPSTLNEGRRAVILYFKDVILPGFSTDYIRRLGVSIAPGIRVDVLPRWGKSICS
ncbi:hypothetical protein ACHAQJ_006222 [Trichoderma viride]